MVHAIIVTHGDLAAELVRSAATVFGAVEGCHPVSNADKAPQTLVGELEAIVWDSIQAASSAAGVQSGRGSKFLRDAVVSHVMAVMRGRPCCPLARSSRIRSITCARGSTTR